MNKGFTMLEMIITVFVLITGILASYYLFSQIMVATSVASSRLTAAYLAQEGIEIIRNMRDTKWLQCQVGTVDTVGTDCWQVIKDTFREQGCSFGCEADYTTGTGIDGENLLAPYNGNPLKIDADNFYSYSMVGTPTKFKRKITVAPDPSHDDILEVSVLIEWQDRGKDYNFTSEEYLYNWHQ
jgi:hypothetical protein